MYSLNPSRLVGVLAGCLLMTQAAAAGNYRVALIPDSLMRGADAVVRQNLESIEIIDLRKVRIKRRLVVTLLTAKAEAVRHLAGIRSSLESLDNIDAVVYNAAGGEVQRLREKDFRPRSANMGADLYTDIVLKELMVDYAVYPFTIELNSTTTQQHSFMLPLWQPQSLERGLGVAVEEAALTVSAPRYSGFRFRSFMIGAPEIRHSDDRDEWQWSLRQRPASRQEPHAAPERFSAPTVLLATDSVAISSYVGSSRSWRELGRFVHQLNQGRDLLPAEEQSRIPALTAGLTTDREKVRALYRYMQKRARYVAVEVGIGGWQTIEAAGVSRNQYGDCKGLSNYLMALLKAAGIRSYPVLISASDQYKPLQQDFPASQFNHEILCVPAGPDTLWVECTSSDSPLGYLGSFTQDRDALLVTPEGGVVVHTPKLSGADNQIRRFIHARLDSSLSCEMKVEARHTGDWCEQLKHRVDHLHQADLEQFVAAKFTLPSYSVSKYAYTTEPDQSVPMMREEVWIRTSSIASATQKRLFVSPDLMPVRMPVEPSGAARSTAFTLGQAYCVIDSFSLDVPAGRTVEYMPAEVHLRSPFGSFDYAVSYDSTAGRLQLLRKIVVNGGTYEADDYPSLSSFFEAVRKCGSERAVFRAL